MSHTPGGRSGVLAEVPDRRHVRVGVGGEEADPLPVAGMTVGAVKRLVRNLLNVPHFADALVNGVVSPVGRVLRSGDTLVFQQRWGVKSSDGGGTDALADAVLRAYEREMDRIAAEVLALDLTTEESVRCALARTAGWFRDRFGPPDELARAVVAQVMRRLEGIEARLGPHAARPLTDREQDILDALGGGRMAGPQLAERAGYTFNSHFRATLSSLVKRGILRSDRTGYVRVDQAGQG